MEETMAHLLMKQRLRWLGHLARMEPSRMPKQLLYGELEKKRPSHGTKRRWRDLVTADIKAVNMDDGWYDLAQDRKAWRALYQEGLMSLVEQHHPGWPSGCSSSSTVGSYPCLCGRSFRRKGDLTGLRNDGRLQDSRCMYVCKNVCMFVCMYVCTYVCMYVYMYVCMYVCMNVCMYVCMYVHVHVCVYVPVCTYVCMYVCIYVCDYVCMYVCIYVCIYVLVCTCMSVSMCVYTCNTTLMYANMHANIM